MPSTPPRYLKPGSSPPSYGVPSFTPVNQPVRSSRGKNGDALYDIPQDEDPLPVSQVPQKRKWQSAAPPRNKNAPTAHIKRPRRKDDSPPSKRFSYISSPDEQSLPQPSLPFGPKKYASRRTDSALSRQTKVFANTNISKPNAQQSCNEGHRKQSIEFTINAPSTLDKISQGGHIGLAQTTLEKLAAFRFKTSTADLELNQAMPDEATSLSPLMDRANLDTCSYPYRQCISKGGNEIYPLPAPDNAPSPVEHEVYEDVSHRTSHTHASLGEPEDGFDDLFDETVNVSYSMDAQAYGNNYSGFNIPKQDHSDRLEVSSSIHINSAIDTEMDNLSNIRGPPEAHEGWDEGLDDEDFAQFDVDDIVLPNMLTPCHVLPQSLSAQHSVEHKGDEFDDGVADEDLMEAMVEYENIHNYSGYPSTRSLNNSVEQFAEFENMSRFSSRSQSTNDGYFMDDTDEAELANVAEQENPAIIETHSPPSNWTQSDVRFRDVEVYDERLNYSPPPVKHDVNIINRNQLCVQPSVESLIEPEDWSFLNHGNASSENIKSTRNETIPTTPSVTPRPSGLRSANDDSHEYVPLTPFARSPFPDKVSSGSVIPGLTARMILRTCFRVGECIRAGSYCNRLDQDGIIELFCRVTFSSREDGTRKQIFQFADVFHNNPPFVNGVLANYRVSALQERESKELLNVNRENSGHNGGRLKDWKLYAAQGLA
ncbi:hypothetical protein V491_01162 [Pseudogymnoascus sp. VKM F-3775]|nr:hypothetical protein V491_01162 [Pseudogymnoascus sp. VKM F-3775]